MGVGRRLSLPLQLSPSLLLGALAISGIPLNRHTEETEIPVGADKVPLTCLLLSLHPEEMDSISSV